MADLTRCKQPKLLLRKTIEIKLSRGAVNLFSSSGQLING